VIDTSHGPRLALGRTIGGPLDAASACMLTRLRSQMCDGEERVACERFIDGISE